MNDFLVTQQRLYDAGSKAALISFYKSLVQMKEAAAKAHVHLTGQTKVKFEELLTQLKAEMFDVNVSASEIR